MSEDRFSGRLTLLIEVAKTLGTFPSEPVVIDEETMARYLAEYPYAFGGGDS